MGVHGSEFVPYRPRVHRGRLCTAACGSSTLAAGDRTIRTSALGLPALAHLLGNLVPEATQLLGSQCFVLSSPHDLLRFFAAYGRTNLLPILFRSRASQILTCVSGLQCP